MKGIIVKCLEELVVTKFGKENWQKSLEGAGFSKTKMFFTLSNVPDAEVMKVVESVCKTLDLSLEQAADAFGEYWVTTYSQEIYGQYYRNNTSVKEFMLDLNSIHVTITKNLENAQPPQFGFDWTNDTTLVVNYTSHRNLIDFAIGLARGLGVFYNERLQVTKLSQSQFQIIFPQA